MTDAVVHTPVLLTETIAALQPKSGGRYIDATLGGGGHAEKVLELSRPDGALLGIDADPLALGAAADRLARFGDRVTFVESYFDRLNEIATDTGFAKVDGILFDLGVSSFQLDRAERGFSFRRDAPLDMRFGPSATSTASELVNTLGESELRIIFQEYGEERNARRVARRIVTERAHRPIMTTAELARIVVAAKPSVTTEKIHPATRVFQALRMAVNDELERLRTTLPQAVELLSGGGRLVVISFHSLEDRIVKRFLREAARGCTCPPAVPVCVCGRTATLRLISRRPLIARGDELRSNPRGRSAKLRVAERLIA